MRQKLLSKRTGRPVSHTRSRGFMVGLGVAGVCMAIGMAYIGYNSPNNIPGRSYYTISAEFANADNLTSSYQIRVGGRLVGQVLRPRVEHGKGIVDLQLKTDLKPLLSDTTLRVRPRSPVGVRFVELHPGTHGTPLAEGAMLRASQTSSTVQLDTALGTLDARRRLETQQLLLALGRGFLGRGEDLNAAIGKAPPTLRNLDAVAGEINRNPNAVSGFIAGSESAAAAADPVRTDIATGFAPEAAALRPFANEHPALEHALDVAPSALRSVEGGLAQLTPLLGQLERLGANAEPTLRIARPTLATTQAVLREAHPGLAAAPKTLGLLRRAVPPTVDALTQLRPVLPSLDATLRDTLPLIDELAPRDCDIKRFFGNWSSLLQYRTAASSVLRFSVEGSAETLQGWTTKPPRTFQSPYAAPCAPDHQKVWGGTR